MLSFACGFLAVLPIVLLVLLALCRLPNCPSDWHVLPALQCCLPNCLPGRHAPLAFRPAAPVLLPYSRTTGIWSARFGISRAPPPNHPGDS